MAFARALVILALLAPIAALRHKEAGSSVAEGQHADKSKIVCPAPHFVEECKDDGTCFCVCKDPESPDCPSLKYVPSPEEAAGNFKAAIEWKNAGFPY